MLRQREMSHALTSISTNTKVDFRVLLSLMFLLTVTTVGPSSAKIVFLSSTSFYYILLPVLTPFFRCMRANRKPPIFTPFLQSTFSNFFHTLLFPRCLIVPDKTFLFWVVQQVSFFQNSILALLQQYDCTNYKSWFYSQSGQEITFSLHNLEC